MVKLLNGDLYSYARIRFVGLDTQHILNTAASNDIVLKNITRTGQAVLEADVYRIDIKKLKRLLGENKYKLTVIKTKGAWYKLSANFKRFGLWIGMLTAVCALFIILSRTWTVEVVGYGDAEAIAETVKRCGMLDWRQRAYDRIEHTQAAIGEGFDDILWNSVSVNGTVVTVYIKEDTTRKPEEAETGNIVAKKDGVVRNLIVTGGTGTVENGSTVSEGDILIEGIQLFGETAFPVKAEGKALASVWYYDYREIPLEETVYVRTGNKKTVEKISFFGMDFTLGGDNVFEHFDTESEKVNTCFLPIKLEKYTYYENVPTVSAIDKVQKTAEIEAELLSVLKLTVPNEAKIYETKTTVEEGDGVLKIGVYIETVEDIAIRG